MIRSITGRRSLFCLILSGFVLSFGALIVVGRGGAISHPTAKPVIENLLGHYVPLLGILAGFYFSERRTTTKAGRTSLEAFLLALFVVSLWTLGPPIVIIASTTIEAAMRLVDSMAIIGASLASAALAFYFSKSGGPEDGV